MIGQSYLLITVLFYLYSDLCPGVDEEDLQTTLTVVSGFLWNILNCHAIWMVATAVAIQVFLKCLEKGFGLLLNP